MSLPFMLIISMLANSCASIAVIVTHVCGYDGVWSGEACEVFL